MAAPSGGRATFYGSVVQSFAVVDSLDMTPKIVASDGVRFRRAGDPNGQPAIFLPAAYWTGAAGLAVARAFHHFSWYLLDLPGTGGSRPLSRTDASGLAQWLDAFCERNDIVTPHLVGHSLGGYVALAIAATGQPPIRSLLLIDGGVAPIGVPQEMGWMAYAVPVVNATDHLLAGRLITRRPGPKAPPEVPEDPEVTAHRLRVPLSDALLQAAADLVAPEGESWNLDSRAVQRLGLLGVRTWGLRSLRRVKVPTRVLVAMFPGGPQWATTTAMRSLQALRAAGVDTVGVSTGHYVFWDDAAAFSEVAGPFYSRLIQSAQR